MVRYVAKYSRAGKESIASLFWPTHMARPKEEDYVLLRLDSPIQGAKPAPGVGLAKPPPGTKAPVLPPLLSKKDAKRRGKRGGGGSVVADAPLLGHGYTIVKRLHRYCSGYTPVTLALSAGASFGSYSFELNFLAHNSELTSMFQFFRVEKIETYIHWNYNVFFNPDHAATTPSVSNPILLMVFDGNDADQETTIESLMANQTIQTFSPAMGGKQVFTWRPMFDQEIYVSATTSGYGPGRGWVDTKYPGIDWFSIKWAIMALEAINAGTIYAYLWHRVTFDVASLV